MSDEREKRERNVEDFTRKLHSQTSDLRFLSTQYAHQVELEKKRADTCHNKVEDVFGRIGMVNNEGTAKSKTGNTDKIFQRLQKIDIETGLEPLDKKPVYFSPPDPAVADMVRLTQGRIENLEVENKQVKSRATSLENDVSRLLT
jgi:hypothetical protein